MTNPNDPTMSLAVAPTGEVAKVAVQFLGLTKREYFAAMAMQGFLTNGSSIVAATGMAIMSADALIVALNE